MVYFISRDNKSYSYVKYGWVWTFYNLRILIMIMLKVVIFFIGISTLLVNIL